jgi:protein-disulfide isomerase
MIRFSQRWRRRLAAPFAAALLVGCSVQGFAQTATTLPSPAATPTSGAAGISTPTPAPSEAGAPTPAASPEAALAAPNVIPMDQLMAPGPLPDIVQGSPSAPVTIVEYASMTCPHCAAFHESGWKDLKAKYVDTGKAKFILREFPLDPLAAAGFMLARCAGNDKRNAVIDQLFAQQNTWAFVDKPLQPLLELAKGLGFTQADFETCLQNQALYDQVNAARDQAADKFNVDATPTFFINGKKLTGELTIADFDAALDPLLK